jgi:nucleotide-binding universal stress UspA family protein
MRKIVLAVDGSTYSMQAARFLARLPHKERLELVLLSVAEVPPHSSDYPTGDWLQESLARARSSATQWFAQIEQLFQGADVTVTHELREGHLGESIVQFAREQEADMVVLGARGHSRVSRILLGSTSDYVATHAPCSVLVVRPRGPNRGDAPLRIAVAYEEAAPADAAIVEFESFLWGPDVEVDVVSVASYLYGFFTEFENDPLSVRHLNQSLQRAADQVKATAPNAKPHLIESEHIGDGLANYAAERQTDLILLGETPRGPLGRILLGSVSRYVLRHAPCSVWIARNQA